jgi:hypothetical protein
MPSSGNYKHVSKQLMFTSLPAVVNIAENLALQLAVHWRQQRANRHCVVSGVLQDWMMNWQRSGRKKPLSNRCTTNRATEKSHELRVPVEMRHTQTCKATLVWLVTDRPDRPRTQHDCHHDTKVKPEAANVVIELLMMGGRMPETCWAVNKRQNNKLENCCIRLVICLNWIVWLHCWYHCW